MQYRVAVVENDAEESANVEKFLQRYASEQNICFHITGFAGGVDIASEYKACYDIIIMEVQLPDLDGISIAKKIRGLDKDVIIILVSNECKYAVQGYSFGVHGYLLKPVDYPIFAKQLGNVLERLSVRKTHYMLVPTEQGVKRIDVNDITYIESFGHEVMINTGAEKFTIPGVMHRLEKKLAGEFFFRGGKSYLVNLSHVKAVVGNQVIIGERVLNLKRGSKRIFMRALNECIEKWY